MASGISHCDYKRLAQKQRKPIWKVLVADKLFWNRRESFCSQLSLLAQTLTRSPTFLF